MSMISTSDISKDTLEMQRAYNSGKLTKHLLKTLNGTFRQVVWLVKTEVTLHEGGVDTFTHIGFSLPTKGLIMTAVREGRISGAKHILAKRICASRLVDPVDVTYEVTLESIKREWNIALLKISEIEDWKGATLGMLHNIEDIPESVGALALGRSIYECIDDLTISSDRTRCSMWDMDCHVAHNPKYRILGDVLNVQIISSNEDKASVFPTFLEARLPVILCDGFNGRRGCGGSPVFNLNGEVVGMYLMSMKRFDVAIHISALKEMLNRGSSKKMHESNWVESSMRKRKRRRSKRGKRRIASGEGAYHIGDSHGT